MMLESDPVQANEDRRCPERDGKGSETSRLTQTDFMEEEFSFAAVEPRVPSASSCDCQAAANQSAPTGGRG